MSQKELQMAISHCHNDLVWGHLEPMVVVVNSFARRADGPRACSCFWPFEHYAEIIPSPSQEAASKLMHDAGRRVNASAQGTGTMPLTAGKTSYRTYRAPRSEMTPRYRDPATTLPRAGSFDQHGYRYLLQLQKGLRDLHVTYTCN